jgi:hypothetical protein
MRELLRRLHRDVSFGIFAVIALVAIPATLYGLARQLGWRPFVAAILAGAWLACAVRLTAWWRRTVRREAAAARVVGE